MFKPIIIIEEKKQNKTKIILAANLKLAHNASYFCAYVDLYGIKIDNNAAQMTESR